MSLRDELKQRVIETFRSTWEVNPGRVVPDVSRLKFRNDAIEFEGAVLYADLDGSTALVDSFVPDFASEIYKNYLYCAGRIIRACEGDITAYDGDRVMAIFTGEQKRSNAVTAAFKINEAVRTIINAELQNFYTQSTYRLKHVIGVDVSVLRAVKTGVRDDNDIVWVGRAANHAAKLTSLSSDSAIYITDEVHEYMRPQLRPESGGIWTRLNWTSMRRLIFSSNAYIEDL